MKKYRIIRWIRIVEGDTDYGESSFLVYGKPVSKKTAEKKIKAEQEAIKAKDYITHPEYIRFTLLEVDGE